MDIDDVTVFTAAVSAGSLAAAARRLGLSPMIASRRLASLEASLGVRLLHRTTRSLSLTPEGETFLPFAEILVENQAEAMARLRSDSLGAAGLLRVSATIAFGTKFIAPLVPSLLEANPQLRIALDLTDTLPDLVSTGTDLAIRIARLKDSSLIAQKLADNPRVVIASPDYLARRGTPTSLSDLAQHDCLTLGAATHWTFEQDGAERHVRVNSRFTSSTIEGCHAACIAGGGLALLSAWNVRDELADGRLVQIDFPDGHPEKINIWAIYPTARLVLPKVRVFISALREAMEQAGLKTTAA
jgi:DNA-binding transcriptional LysR family regulator